MPGLVPDLADSSVPPSDTEDLRWVALARRHIDVLLAFIGKPDRRAVSDGRVSRWLVVMTTDLLLVALFSAWTLVLPEDIQTLFWREDTLTGMSTGMLLLSALVLAPVFEELLFRAGLRNASYLAFVGPSLIALFARAPMVTLWLLVVSLAVAALWRRQLGQPGGRFKLARRFRHMYAAWFWIYTAAFAFMHVSNYRPEPGQMIWMPMLVIPQFIAGVLYGYLRIRNGLASAMLAHFTHNAITVGAYLALARA